MNVQSFGACDVIMFSINKLYNLHWTVHGCASFIINCGLIVLFRTRSYFPKNGIRRLSTNASRSSSVVRLPKNGLRRLPRNGLLRFPRKGLLRLPRNGLRLFPRNGLLPRFSYSRSDSKSSFCVSPSDSSSTLLLSSSKTWSSSGMLLLPRVNLALFSSMPQTLVTSTDLQHSGGRLEAVDGRVHVAQTVAWSAPHVDTASEPAASPATAAMTTVSKMT